MSVEKQKFRRAGRSAIRRGNESDGQLKTLTPNEALALLQQQFAGEDDIIPTGFFTAGEWAEKWSIGRRCASMLLANGIVKKSVEKQKFRRAGRSTLFYRVKGKQK